MTYGVSARDLRGAPLGRLRQVHVVDVAVDVVDAEDADVDVDVLFCR